MSKPIIFILIFLISTTVYGEKIKILIGATLPLTGRLAIAGEDTKRGIELAIKEFSNDNVTIKAIYEDNQHITREAISTANKLINFDKVDIILSMWDMSDIVAPLAEQRKIPHFAIRWNPDITKKYKYTFTMESTYQSYIDSLLKLLKHLNVKTVGLITEEGQGWILASNDFKSKGAKYNIIVTREENFVPTDNDYKSVILRTLKNKPDMLVIFSNPPHTENIIKQIKELSPLQGFTGYFEIINPSLINEIPFVAQFEVADWFSNKFKNYYNDLPKSRSAQAFDIIQLVSLSAEETRLKPTIESLSSTIVKFIDSQKGAGGELTRKKPKVIENICVWKIAEGDRFRIFDPY